MQSSPARTVRIVFEAARGAASAQGAPVPEYVYAALAEYYGKSPGSVLLKLRYVHSPAYTTAAYRESVRRAKEVLGEKGVRVAALLEIALPALDEELLELCSGRAFDGLKIFVAPAIASRDGAHDAGQTEFATLARVVASGVPAACEMPLVRANHERIDDILSFIAVSGVRAWRLAPALEATDSPGERLTVLEARRALERGVDFVVTEQPPVRIEPIAGYLERIRHFADPPRPYAVHDRRGWERTLRIDSAGNVRGAGGELFGSLASSPVDAIFTGGARETALASAERRMARVCGACRYFGSCDGEVVAETDEAGCPLLAPMLEYAESRLSQAGLLRVRARTLDVPPPGTSRGRLLPDHGGTVLRRGVRIFAKGERRLALSSGTEVAKSGPGVRFHVGALTPRQPFRPLNGAELALFGHDVATDASFRRESDVALLELDDALLAPLRDVCAGCGFYDADREPAPPSAHPAWEAAMATLAHGLGRHLRGPWKIETAVVYRSNPGLATVTKVDRGFTERETYVGLHLDSWEGVSLRRRSTVRNRLSINLGAGSRSLLFVNLTFADMMHALGLREEEDVHDVTLFSGHRFMRAFPDYPVTRVEVLPGEAYVCPTGNLVHDGASGSEADVALHLLGFFAPASPSGDFPGS